MANIVTEKLHDHKKNERSDSCVVSKKGKIIREWSREEARILKAAFDWIKARGDGIQIRDWMSIMKKLPGRSHLECTQRWRNMEVCAAITEDCIWTADEDTLLKYAVATTERRADGQVDWVAIAEKINKLPGKTKTRRSGRSQTREENAPATKNTPEEDSAHKNTVASALRSDDARLSKKAEGRNQIQHRKLPVCVEDTDTSETSRCTPLEDTIPNDTAAKTETIAETNETMEHLQQWETTSKLLPVSNTADQVQQHTTTSMRTGHWTAEEHHALIHAIKTTRLNKDNTIDWIAIAEKLPGRNRVQCRTHYRHHVLRRSTRLQEPWNPKIDHIPIDDIPIEVLDARAPTNRPKPKAPREDVVLSYELMSQHQMAKSHGATAQHQTSATYQTNQTTATNHPHLMNASRRIQGLQQAPGSQELVRVQQETPSRHMTMPNQILSTQKMAAAPQMPASLQVSTPHQMPTLQKLTTPQQVATPYELLSPQQMVVSNHAPSYNVAAPQQVTASPQMRLQHQMQASRSYQIQRSQQAAAAHQRKVSALRQQNHVTAPYQVISHIPVVPAPHRASVPHRVTIPQQAISHIAVMPAQHHVTVPHRVAVPHRVTVPRQVTVPQQVIRRIPVARVPHRVTTPQQAMSIAVVPASHRITVPHQIIGHIPVVPTLHRVTASQQLAETQATAIQPVIAQQQIPAQQSLPVYVPRQLAFQYKVPVSQQVKVPHAVTTTPHIVSAQHQAPLPRKMAIQYTLPVAQQVKVPHAVTARRHMKVPVQYQAPAQNRVAVSEQVSSNKEAVAKHQKQVPTPNQVLSQNSVSLFKQVTVTKEVTKEVRKEVETRSHAVTPLQKPASQQLTATRTMLVTTAKNVATHNVSAAPLQKPMLHQITVTPQMPVIARRPVPAQNPVILPGSQQQQEVNVRHPMHVAAVRKRVLSTHQTQVKAPEQFLGQNRIASLHQTASQKVSANPVSSSDGVPAKDQGPAQQHMSGLSPHPKALQPQTSARQQPVSQHQATAQQYTPNSEPLQLVSQNLAPAVYRVPESSLIPVRNPAVKSQEQVAASQSVVATQQTQVVAPNQVPSKIPSTAALHVPVSEQVTAIIQNPVSASKVSEQNKVGPAHQPHTRNQVTVSQPLVVSKQVNAISQIPAFTEDQVSVQQPVRMSDQANANQTPLHPPHLMSSEDEIPTTENPNHKVLYREQRQYSPGSSQMTCKRTPAILMKHGPWTDEEDLILKEAVAAHSCPPLDRDEHLNWEAIANQLPGRNRIQCRYRYQCIHIKGPSVRRRWTAEEDERLRKAVITVKKHPDGRIDWEDISRMLPGRSRRQCCSHYHYLEERVASTKHGPWTPEEDAIIMEAVSNTEKLPGGRVDWVAVAKLLPGRNRSQCCSHYRHLGDITTRRCRWTPSEDKLLRKLVFTTKKHSDGRVNWIKISQLMAGRGAKQCGNRYRNIRASFKTYVRKHNGENSGSEPKRMRNENYVSVEKSVCRPPTLVAIEQNTSST